MKELDEYSNHSDSIAHPVCQLTVPRGLKMLLFSSLFSPTLFPAIPPSPTPTIKHLLCLPTNM